MTRSLVLIPRDGDRQFLTKEQAEELLAGVPDYVEPVVKPEPARPVVVEPVFDVVVPDAEKPGASRRVITDADRLIDLLINHGKPFYDSESRKFGTVNKYNVGLALSLEKASAYVVQHNGFVASMPLLIAGKSVADNINYLWNNWFSCLSEELVGVDEQGTLGGKGEPLVVVVHGSGLLTESCQRIMQAYTDELVDGWGKISDAEFAGVLKGELPNGRRLSLYSVHDVINCKIPNPLSSTYAVWLHLGTAQNMPSGYLEESSFKNSKLVIARAGTLEYLDGYFSKAAGFHSEKTVGNHHSLAGLNAAVLKTQPRGRVLFVNNSYIGLSGNSLNSLGRFVGVALKKRGASK